MGDQSKTLRWVNQEVLRDHTRRYDQDWPDGLCQTRSNYTSHCGSNPHKILGSHFIFQPLLRILLFSPYEGNLSWGNPTGQGILWAHFSHPRGQGLWQQGGQCNIIRSPVQGVCPYLWKIDKLLWGGLSPPKLICWAHDKVNNPRYPDPSPTRHQTVDRSCYYHDMEFLIQGSMPYIQHPGCGRGHKYSGADVWRHGVPNVANRLSHRGLPRLCTIIPPAGRASRAD